mmetsp:Transcript_23972/g.68884  ORF Transcript_23972/g.68884 Transcript_23972/m.68884 type:complete len:201 (+) Transcript_23972:1035-1637(+)
MSARLPSGGGRHTRAAGRSNVASSSADWAQTSGREWYEQVRQTACTTSRSACHSEGDGSSPPAPPAHPSSPPPSPPGRRALSPPTDTTRPVPGREPGRESRPLPPPPSERVEDRSLERRSEAGEKARLPNPPSVWRACSGPSSVSRAKAKRTYAMPSARCSSEGDPPSHERSMRATARREGAASCAGRLPMSARKQRDAW